MPKKKSSSRASPDSPRKSPKKERSPDGSLERNHQSEMPKLIPKPLFKLDDEPPVVRNVDKIKVPELPDGPIFSDKVRLKKERAVHEELKGVKPIVEDEIEKKPLKTKPEDKEKTESTENKAENKPMQMVKKENPDSPHKIVYKKERKPKKPNKKSDQVRSTKKKGRKIEKDDDKAYNGGAKITDYFDVRRSTRKPAKQIEEERNRLWKAYLKEERNEGLEIRQVPMKGRGIFSNRKFSKNEFVVEYSGDLVTPNEADIRDQKYSKNTDKYGSYMYYFIHKGTKWCIDATIESGKYGRLLNHSCKIQNCATKILEMDGLPRLVIYTKEDVEANTELLYDYGDRGKMSLEAHPWLAY